MQKTACSIKFLPLERFALQGLSFLEKLHTFCFRSKLHQAWILRLHVEKLHTFCFRSKLHQAWILRLHVEKLLTMKIYFLKLALRVLKACCDWLSDYIGSLPSNAISNALNCAPFSDDFDS